LERAFFKRPHTHDLEVEEVASLRRFVREARVQASTIEPHAPRRTVVVIDHHSARLYQDMDDSRLEDKATVRPYDPFGFHQHLIHRKEARYAGEWLGIRSFGTTRRECCSMASRCIMKCGGGCLT